MIKTERQSRRKVLKSKLSNLFKRKTPATPKIEDDLQSLQQQKPIHSCLFELSHSGLRYILTQNNDVMELDEQELISKVNDLLLVMSNYSISQKLVLFNDLQILKNGYEIVDSCVRDQNLLEEKEHEMRRLMIGVESNTSPLLTLLKEYVHDYLNYFIKVESLDKMLTADQQRAKQVEMFAKYRPSVLLLFVRNALSGYTVSEQLKLYNALQQIASDQQEVHNTYCSIAKDVLSEGDYEQLVQQLSK
jgi:hypothetical protein